MLSEGATDPTAAALACTAGTSLGGRLPAAFQTCFNQAKTG